MAIESGDLAYAEQLLTRFPKEFPQSGLRLHIEMLSGRLDLARAAQKLREKRPPAELAGLYDSAARRFDRVMKESSLPKTKGQARYYLALARQLQGNQDQALELIAPLVEKAVADGEKSDFTDAIVLQADSYFLKQSDANASESAAKYLQLFPKGRQAPRALSIQALAAERLNDQEGAKVALKRLTDEFPNHPLTLATHQQLAELAESRSDWKTAGQLYESILDLQTDPDKKAYSLRGIALARYEQEQFTEAADLFGRVVKDFPDHTLVMECSYYRAESLKRAGLTAPAMEQFKQIFDLFPGDKPAAPGAEAQPPLEFSYKAGLQVARLLNKEEKIDESDAAYEELLKRFPKPLDLDKRLDEWAIFNYRQKRYPRADEIWRRLVTEAPLSALVNSARLSLAESDLFANKFEEARKAFEELAESDKSTDEIKEQSLYQLVALAVDRQRWPDVRALGNRLITKFPESQHRFYVLYSQAEATLASLKPSEQELSTAKEKLQSLRSESENESVKEAEWFDRVWVLLAELSFREKNYAEVLTIVEDLKQRKPSSPFLHQAEEVLGRSYKQQAPPKFDDARAAFERVLSDPAAFRTETAAKAQFLIGDTYFLQEKWDDALIAYQKVYSNYKFPEWQAAALLSSAKCDESQSKWKLAAGTYKLLIKEFPDSAVTDEAKRRLEAAEAKQ
jgi:TolA-binding protein